MAWAPTERTEATVSPREAEKRRSNRERSSPFVSPLLRFSVCYRCLRVHRSLTPASWNSAVASAASSRSPPPDATSAFTRGVPHVYGIEPPGADAGRARPKSSRNPGFSGLAVQIGNAPPLAALLLAQICPIFSLVGGSGSPLRVIAITA